MLAGFASSIKASLIYALHAENGTQFSNATLFLPPASTVISPVTNIYASE